MVQVAQAKKDLLYSKDLEDIIGVLKLISSSEFSRLSTIAPKEKSILHEELMECFSLLKGALKDNQFLVRDEELPRCYVLICSDEGFLGEVNTRVINRVMKLGANRRTRFIVTGERGERILNDAGFKCKLIRPVSNNITLFPIIELSNYIVNQFKKKKFSSVDVVFMRYVSFTSHQIEISKLLPCNKATDSVKISDHAREVLIEPDVAHVLEYLVKLWLVDNLFDIFWSSKLSEWAIKLMRLESSSNELKTIIENHRLKYFKAVHNLNDKVIREIFAARGVSR